MPSKEQDQLIHDLPIPSGNQSYLESFHRRIYTWGRRRHNALRQWFGVGVLAAAMLGISSAFILLRELWQAIKWADQVQ